MKNKQTTTLVPPSHRQSMQTSHTSLERHDPSTHPMVPNGQMTSLLNHMQGAVQVSVSRSSVIFDGTHTHVEAEEQHFVDGQWQQQSIEGKWEGDQSSEAIQQLSKRSIFSQRLKSKPRQLRPLPRGRK